MSPRKSYSDPAAVEAWLSRQGYGLERETAAALKPFGFRSTRGRHFEDASSGKLREIDLLAECLISAPTKFLATIECKHSSYGAWIVRESDYLPEPHRNWKPLMSRRLESTAGGYLDSIRASFPTGRPSSDGDLVWAFSVVEATDEGNDVAFAAISQAVSAAVGWTSQSRDALLAVPVVVVDGPLFLLVHRTGHDEPIMAIPWRRVLWGGVADQTIVDVVTAGHVGEYAGALRQAFDFVAAMLP